MAPRRGLIRHPGRRRPRACGQPGRGPAGAALRGPGPDRPRPTRPGHPAALRDRYVTGGHHPMITRPEVASQISNAVDAMDETIKEIRSTIFALQARGTAARPDLRGEIVALVDEMTDMLGFAPSLWLGSGLGEDISPEVAEQVLAALREALSNAAGHANASQVDVT